MQLGDAQGRLWIVTVEFPGRAYSPVGPYYYESKMDAMRIAAHENDDLFKDWKALGEPKDFYWWTVEHGYPFYSVECFYPDIEHPTWDIDEKLLKVMRINHPR